MKETAVLQIRISPVLKKQSAKTAEKLGFTTSTLIKLFLAHVVKTKKIPFVIEEVPNAKFLKSMKQAEEDFKKGNYYSFEDMDDAIDFLKKSIKLHNARKARRKIQKEIIDAPTNHPRKNLSSTTTIQSRSISPRT